MKKSRIFNYLFLHIVLIIYSLTSVLSKSAAGQTGITFVLLYGAVLFCLMLYAVLWQGVLKKFPLTTRSNMRAAVREFRGRERLKHFRSFPGLYLTPEGTGGL